MASFKTPILLVISDNPSIRAWARKILSGDYFIIEAPQKSSALQTVISTNLDFIIIDGQFEDCDPLALVKELREKLKNNGTPILLITGKLKKSYRDQALDAGVTDFMSNQLDPHELETRIATGKKAAILREKTGDISSYLLKQKPNETRRSYLKDKILIHDQALRLLAAAKIEKVPVALLVIGIDHFQQLQEKEGFLIAEQILTECSELVEEILHESHLQMPSSDGKLIVLLPNLSLEQARYQAHELQKIIQKERFSGKEDPTSLTVSIAITTFEASENSMNQMIDSAVKSLRHAITKSLIISLDQELL